MPARKSAQESPALMSALQLLQLVAGSDMMAAAMPIVRQKLNLTPEKLALILVRVLNPDEFVKKGEEVTLRGVDEQSMKKYKDAHLFPEYMGARETRDVKS